MTPEEKAERAEALKKERDFLEQIGVQKQGLPEFWKDFKKNFMEMIGKTEKEEPAKDVVGVTKSGLVHVSKDDVVVDRESLANALSGAKGAAIDRITAGGGEAEQSGMLASLLAQIKSAILDGNTLSKMNAGSLQQNLQSIVVATAGGGQTALPAGDFFDEMFKRQER